MIALLGAKKVNEENRPTSKDFEIIYVAQKITMKKQFEKIEVV